MSNANDRIARRILLAIGTTSLLGLGAAACGSSTTTDSDAGGTADAAADSLTLDTGDAGADGGGETGADGDVPDVPCVRRPFLVGAEPRASELARRDDWMTTSAEVAIEGELDERTRRALAAAWLEDGRQEHASIAAFARFTMHALAVGAPPEVIVGAQRAGLDEVRHARGCFALARRYGGVAYGPGTLRLDGALQELTLAELAALTVHEGCVGETLGVLLATEQRDGATDESVRAFLDRLVRDEQRHAELAWTFVRWSLARGGASVAVAVERAFDEAIAASRALSLDEPIDISLASFRAHGRVDGATARLLVGRGIRDVVSPCRAALRAASGAETVLFS